MQVEGDKEFEGMHGDEMDEDCEEEDTVTMTTSMMRLHFLRHSNWMTGWS